MKKIKLTENELTRIIQRVIKEDSSDPTNPNCNPPDGYWRTAPKTTNAGWFKRENKIQGTQFYVQMRQTPSGRCDVLLKWEEGMTPINLGHYDRAHTLLMNFEDLFLDLSANPQDYWKK